MSRNKPTGKGPLGDAARSGMSIRELCRQHRLKEFQSYWWQRKLKKAGRQERNRPGVQGLAASFALVSEGAAGMPAVQESSSDHSCKGINSAMEETAGSPSFSDSTYTPWLGAAGNSLESFTTV